MNKDFYVCEECVTQLKKDKVKILATSLKGKEDEPDCGCQRCGEELDPKTLIKIKIYSNDIIHLLPRIDAVSTLPTTFMKLIKDCNSDEDVEDLKEIIRKCPYLVNQKNQLGYTPLTYVCYIQPLADIRYKIIKLLIENKADVNAMTLRGLTPITSSHENYIKIKMLLEGGAKVGDALFRCKKPHIIELLLSYNPDKNTPSPSRSIPNENAIDYHIRIGSSSEIISKLLDYGFQVNYFGNIADSKKLFELANLYVNHPNFDINRKIYNDDTLIFLLLATEDFKRLRKDDFTQLVKKMIDRGLDIDTKLSKKTIFYYLSKYLLIKQTKELLDYITLKDIKHNRKVMVKSLEREELSDYYFDECLNKQALKKVVAMMCVVNEASGQIPNELINEIFKK